MDSNEKNLENMTQEDIERLLEEQQQNSQEQYNFEDADLASLLSQLESEEDGDIQEISDLLNKADNNEAVADDVVELMKSQEANGETAYDAMDLFSDGQAEKKEGFFQKLLKKFKKKKKDKQEKPEVQPEEIPEEPSYDVMDEAIAMLNNSAGAVSESKPEEGVASEEAAKKPAKKKKEKKSKKSKKASKAKESEAPGEEEEELEEKPVNKKKAKKTKEKKPKGKKAQDKAIREKASIEEAVTLLEEEEAEEMPHKKKIIMVFVAAIMIMLGFLVVNHYYTGHANKQLAEEAYEAEDYLECYQLLYGQKLNDSQTAMFHRSELTLKMNMFWNHYNEYVAEQKELEGLDELVQFVYKYPELSAYASEWNCLDTVAGTYNRVLAILSEEYEVDEQKVIEIAGLESDLDYTKELVALVEAKQKNDQLEQKYPDILPEEKDKAEQE